MTVFGVTYAFPNAPKFVLHAIRLIIERWTSDLTNAPVFIQYQANLLAKRYGVVQ